MLKNHKELCKLDLMRRWLQPKRRFEFLKFIPETDQKQNHESELIVQSSLLKQTLNLCNSEKGVLNKIKKLF